ncbi:DUF4123 domain-containing protein [Nitrincola sp. A-D6]|uniref:DUF4123 domain-containing protein n=1 Tax=Nitrincola sp. A-D6 TaxID=1545442 RepID=UPI001F455433|nr:DUF4123 domain-containing protein [Nitrincola sp. A-D6]
MKPHLGFCHISCGDDLFQLIGAVLCHHAHEFETLISNEIIKDGYWLHWVNDVLPAEQWLLKHPGEWGDTLLCSLSETCPLVLGPLEPLNKPSQPALNLLEIEPLEAIEPLDSQLGVDPQKCVPDVLSHALFGQPTPTDAEQQHYSQAVPTMKTYALLDAAKMPYLLPDLLLACGLHYESLFQGALQDEISNHAPYLVELEQDHRFTRQLFTGPQGILGLWEKSLGIFIRTRTEFAELRHHLRKFTRLQNEQGKGYFFRFWEKTSLPALTHGQPAELAEALLQDSSYLGQCWLIPLPEDHKVITFKRHPDRHGQPTRPAKITEEILTALNTHIEQFQDQQMIKNVLKRFDDHELTPPAPDQAHLLNMLTLLRTEGFSDKEKRQDAIDSYTQAYSLGLADQALAILKKSVQGPAIRLWHLNKLIQDSTP